MPFIRRHKRAGRFFLVFHSGGHCEERPSQANNEAKSDFPLVFVATRHGIVLPPEKAIAKGVQGFKQNSLGSIFKMGLQKMAGLEHVQILLCNGVSEWGWRVGVKSRV